MLEMRHESVLPIAHYSLVDSVLSASMILTGMGPVGELPSTAAKLFVSAYALFSGLVFISVVGVISGKQQRH